MEWRSWSKQFSLVRWYLGILRVALFLIHHCGGVLANHGRLLLAGRVGRLVSDVAILLQILASKIASNVSSVPSSAPLQEASHTSRAAARFYSIMRSMVRPPAGSAQSVWLVAIEHVNRLLVPFRRGYARTLLDWCISQVLRR